ARDRVDLHALFAHQLEDVDVGAGLLRKADGVEARQLGNARAYGCGVIDPQRRAVLVGQGPQLGGSERAGHCVAAGGEKWKSAEQLACEMAAIMRASVHSV